MPNVFGLVRRSLPDFKKGKAFSTRGKRLRPTMSANCVLFERIWAASCILKVPIYHF